MISEETEIVQSLFPSASFVSEHGDEIVFSGGSVLSRVYSIGAGYLLTIEEGGLKGVQWFILKEDAIEPVEKNRFWIKSFKEAARAARDFVRKSSRFSEDEKLMILGEEKDKGPSVNLYAVVECLQRNGAGSIGIFPDEDETFILAKLSGELVTFGLDHKRNVFYINEDSGEQLEFKHGIGLVKHLDLVAEALRKELGGFDRALFKFIKEIKVEDVRVSMHDIYLDIEYEINEQAHHVQFFNERVSLFIGDETPIYNMPFPECYSLLQYEAFKEIYR